MDNILIDLALATEDGDNYDINVENEILKLSIASKNDNGHHNLIIALEELSELQQAVTKSMRGKINYNNLIEELADVQICIEYIKKIYNVYQSDINKIKKFKLNMLKDKLNKKVVIRNE